MGTSLMPWSSQSRICPAGFFENPVADVQDQTGFLGQSDELARRDHAARRVRPTHQRFGADHAAAAQAGLGLEVEDELSLAERLAQLAFELPLLLGAPVHFRAVEEVARVAVLLRPLHRYVGVAMQGGDVVPVFRVDGDADRGIDVQGVRIDHEG